MSNKITIQDARTMFRNLSGASRKFEKDDGLFLDARRELTVCLDRELAEELLEEGLPVKVKPPRTEDEDEQFRLKVAVRMESKFPPTVYLVQGRLKTLLNKDTIGLLDKLRPLKIDLRFRYYNWELAGKTGVKAALDTMYFVAEEDPLAEAYADYEETR